MIESHLLALQVVIPLLAAPVCVLLPQGRLPWLFSTAVAWICAAMAMVLLGEVMASGTLSYAMGGWIAPFGIEYRLDPLNAYVNLIVAGIAAVVLPFSGPSIEAEVTQDRLPLFYTALLLCLAGLLGIATTGDAFNVFVFLEISSLSTYSLVAMGGDRRALAAAYQYLIMGTIGATFFLIGVGLLYMVTGTLNMVDLAQRLPAASTEYATTVHTAFAFIVVGVGLKLALFPLHGWLPNAYTYAPAMVSAFLAATATKVAVYILVRFMFTVFGFGYAFGETVLAPLLVGLALLGVFVASVQAVYQADAKRLLAYSSVAQIGYIALGIGLATVLGLSAGLLHLFNHALMKGALFMALAAIFFRIGSMRLEDMAGIGRVMPWTMTAFAIAGLSLIGLPATVGFISKWYLILAALEKGWWPVAVLVLIGSLIAVVYIWRVVEVAWFRERPAGARPVSEAPLVLLLPTWTLVLANIWFGLDTRYTVGVATRAAELLMGAGP
ncbi:MAG: monovalent cation/H+ antiporter subunit D family protein [Xanthomonadales bacterium]|nr:monovalent cation/H+ antiporter subunit D family protein [Xanthomonadales bacterium]